MSSVRFIGVVWDVFLVCSLFPVRGEFSECILSGCLRPYKDVESMVIC
jgi:hypothetical protein